MKATMCNTLLSRPGLYSENELREMNQELMEILKMVINSGNSWKLKEIFQLQELIYFKAEFDWGEKKMYVRQDIHKEEHIIFYVEL